MSGRQLKENRGSFLFYFLFAITIYWDTISGNIFNPDSIWNGVYYKVGYEWEASLGRYMIRFWQKLMGGYGTSCITMICLVELCLICNSVVYIFHIRQKFWQCVAGAFLIASPTVAGTLTYYYCSAYYLLAYLLVLISVIMLLRPEAKIKWYHLLAAMLMICISLATYQAYIGVATTIILMYGISGFISAEEPIHIFWMKIGRLVTGTAGGVLLYLISNKVILKLWGIEAATNRGFDKMGEIQIQSFLKKLTECYVNCYQYYFGNTMINNEYGWIPRKYINLLVCLVIVGIGLFILFKLQIEINRKILALTGFLLLPVAFMSIIVCAPEVSVYDTTGVLMLPTMNYLYILMILLCQKSLFYPKKFCNMFCIISSCCVIIMLGELVLNGQTYMNHCNKKTQYVAYEMSHEIAKYIKADTEMKVCIVGSMEKGNFPELYPELKESVHWTTASYGTIWGGRDGSQGCWMNYIKQFLGIEYNQVNSVEFDEVVASEEYFEMNVFPEEGSVRKIGDVVVVKLSGL